MADVDGANDFPIWAKHPDRAVERDDGCAFDLHGRGQQIAGRAHLLDPQNLAAGR